MRKRNEIKTLSDIKKILSVQRSAIEMRVERARTYVHRLDNQRTIETRILGEVQASWRQAVTGKSFQLTQAGLWSAQVLQSEAQIAQIAQDIQTAQVALEDLLVAQTLAAARCGAVDKIVRSAECREQRFRDEKALDDFAYRATGAWRTA